jgi:hypothetical protein
MYPSPGHVHSLFLVVARPCSSSATPSLIFCRLFHSWPSAGLRDASRASLGQTEPCGLPKSSVVPSYSWLSIAVGGKDRHWNDAQPRSSWLVSSSYSITHATASQPQRSLQSRLPYSRPCMPNSSADPHRHCHAVILLLDGPYSLPDRGRILLSFLGPV